MGSITMRAGAKLNLHLRVIGRRPDGYHELETIFQSISLADELIFRKASPDSITVDVNGVGAAASLPPPGDNLIARAARSLVRNGSRRGVSVVVHKRIPVGAGLGGGSADAAATLVALNELWDLDLSAEELLHLGVTLGSDVPFCLLGGSATATSRGEHLESLAAPAKMWFVLGISDVPLLTRDAYATWDDLGGGPDASMVPMRKALEAGDVAEIGRLLHNDLERAALVLRPELAQMKEAMLSSGALGAAVSGSGPTVFGLARDERHAAGLADAVSGRFDRVEVAGSTTSSLRRC